MIEHDPGHWNDLRPVEEQKPIGGQYGGMLAAMLTAAPEPTTEAVWIGEKVVCDTLTCGRVATLEASDAHLVIEHRPMPWRAGKAVPCSFLCPTCKLVTFFEIDRPENCHAESAR